MEEEIDVERDLRVDEFEAGTRISVMTDGSLRLKFPLMPPSWRHKPGSFDSLPEKLARELGVNVEGLDKEFFGIPNPNLDTVSRLQAYLIELRREYEQVS